MTTETQPLPTDAELDTLLPMVQLNGEKPAQMVWLTRKDARAFSRAVLAKWGQPAPARADSVQEDAALWHWIAEYLVGTRTYLDDEIVASETVNDLRKLVEAAIKQGGA